MTSEHNIETFIIHFKDHLTDEQKTVGIPATTMQDAIVIFNREHAGTLLFVERNYS